MKKILITGANGMLATDFISIFKNKFDIYSFDKKSLDVTSINQIEEKIKNINPDIVLNCSAYTLVDDAEDIGMKLNYNINSLGVYNLAKITNKYNIGFISISTDYVFDGLKSEGYNENDICSPINQYGMSKYLGEKLALKENKNSIIIRTSWLYGGGSKFKNFVNTMINLSKNNKELKIINDQFGIPTYTLDLSESIGKIIDNIGNYNGKTIHFSNFSQEKITWFDFAKEIFKIKGTNIKVIPCNSNEYITKAKRPKFSILLNNSNIILRDWKEGLKDYLNKL